MTTRPLTSVTPRRTPRRRRMNNVEPTPQNCEISRRSQISLLLDKRTGNIMGRRSPRQASTYLMRALHCLAVVAHPTADDSFVSSLGEGGLDPAAAHRASSLTVYQRGVGGFVISWMVKSNPWTACADRLLAFILRYNCVRPSRLFRGQGLCVSRRVLYKRSCAFLFLLVLFITDRVKN